MSLSLKPAKLKGRYMIDSFNSMPHYYAISSDTEHINRAEYTKFVGIENVTHKNSVSS